MKYCSFSQKNVTQAVNYTNKKLTEVYLDKDQSFSLKPFMKASYRDLVSLKTKDGAQLMTPEKAFTFVKSFPRLLTIAATSNKFRKLLKPSIAEIFDLDEVLDSEDSAQSLIEYLGITAAGEDFVSEEEKKKRAKEAQKRQQEELENKRKREEQESPERQVSSTLDPDTTSNKEVSFSPVPGKEGTAGQYIEDPIVKANGNFRRGIVREQLPEKQALGKDQNRQYTPIENSDYELRLVHGSTIAEADRSKPVNKQTGEVIDLYGTAVVILYVDKATGKPVRINAEGAVTENGEYLAHSWFRRPTKIKNVSEEAALMHADVYATIMNDPSIQYTLQIKGAYLGYSSSAVQAKQRLAGLEAVSPIVINKIVVKEQDLLDRNGEPKTKLVKDENGDQVEVPQTLSRMFLDIEGYDYLALVDANQIGFLSRNTKGDTLLQDTVALLSNSRLDAQEIVDTLNGWLQTADKPHIGVEEGRLVFSRTKQFLDEMTEAQITEAVSKISLLNVLNSENITLPKVVNGEVEFESVSREDFIRKYYSVNATNFFNAKGTQGLQNAHAEIQYVRDFSSVRQVTKAKVKQAKSDQGQMTLNFGQTRKSVPAKKVTSEKEKKEKLSRIEKLRAKRNELKERSERRISRGDLLNKLDTLSNAATQEEIQAAEEWWSTQPLSKYIPLNRAFGIARSGALATWGQNGITLYAGSNMTDLYHEAWHGFSQLVLTKEEKVSLYNEASKILGKESYLEIEEELAEDFRRFMLSDGKRVFGRSRKINNIFKKILEILKALFGNRTFISDALARTQAYDAVEEMYNNLKSGQLVSERGADWENAMLVTLNKGIQLEDGTTISSANSRMVKEAMDSAVVTIMEKMDADVNALFEDLNNIELLYEEVKDNLELAKLDLELQLDEMSLREDLTDADAIAMKELEESINILEDAIGGFGTVAESRKPDARFSTVGYHLQNSQLMAAFAQTIQSADETSEIGETNDFQDLLEAYDKAGNEFSQLELMDKRIQLLLTTVPERTATGEVVNDRFGFPKIYTFGKVYNDLQVTLADISTREEMYDRLVEARDENAKRKAEGKRYNNVYEHILDQIGGINSTDSDKQTLSGLMWQGFNLAYIVNKQIFAKATSDTNIDIVVKNPEGDTSRIKKQLQGRFISDNPDGVNYQEVIGKYKKEDLLRSGKLFSFLYDLGIQLEYSLDLDAYLSRPEVISNFQRFYTDVKDNLVPILGKNAKKVTEPIRTLGRSRKSKAKSLEYTGQFGTINELLNYVLGLTPGMSISRKIAADGKNVYDLSLNSTQSQVVKSINKAQSLEDIANDESLSHLDVENNPYAKASYWLKTMFPNGVRSNTGKAKLVLQSFLGVYTETTAEKNTNLTTSSKIIADLHGMFLAGYTEQFRASDKSTSYMINVNAKIPGNLGAKKGLFIKASRKNIHTAMTFFKEKLRADVANALKHKNAETNVQKVGTSLGLFSSIFSEGAEVLSKEQVETALIDQEQNFDEWYQENQDAFENTLEAYFDGKVESLLEQVNYDKFSNLINSEIAADLDLSQRENVETVLRNMMINQWLINTEVATLFVGDLAQFKDANDFTKRFAVTSTGKIFDTGESIQNYINAQGNKYAEEVLGLNPSETKQYDGTGNTVILSDLDNQLSKDGSTLSTDFIDRLVAYGEANNVPKKKIQELIDDYKDKYNEADAQAYITLDSYRQLAIASQAWDWKAHEPLYRKIVKYAAEGGDLTIEDAVAAKKFFPVRKYQYYGPILNAEVAGNKTHATALHKYSLKPIIPTPKGQPKKAIDVIHDAMVKSKIDYVVFESGSKVNNVNDKVQPYEFSEPNEKGFTTRKLRDEGEIAADFASNVNVIHFNYLKDVTTVKDTFKSKATASSQLRNLLPIGIYENGKVIPGKEKAAEAYENYLSSMQQYLNLELDKLSKVFSSKDPESIRKVVERVKRDLIKRDASEEEIEAVDALLDNNGNIDALPNADRIETIIINIFNKRLIKTKLKGEALVQVSSAFMERLDAPEVGYSNDLRFYTYQEGSQKIMAAQAKIALQGDFLKLLAMNYKGKPIKTLARLNEAVKDEEWLNKGNNRQMITITGVRIPVQGHNSMEVLEIVEFLDPANGSAIVVPSELPVKSGGDFDVDKLTLFYPRINVKATVPQKTDRISKRTLGYLSPTQIEKLQKKYPTLGINAYTVDTIIDFIKDNKKKSIDSEYEGETVYTLDSQDMAILDVLMVENLVPQIKYVVSLDKQGQGGAQNEMIQSISDIVLDKSNYLNLIKPNDVNQVRENSKSYNTLAARNEAATKDEKTVGTALDYNFNIRKLKENSVGKRTLGIVAANNVIISLLSRINKRLPKVIEGRENGLFELETKDLLLPVPKSGLGKNTDVNNQNLKTSIVEQLINGFVDIAKGAWVFNIGANYQSTPVLLSMIAAGVNYDYAVALINTPIMKRMFELKAEKKDPLFLLDDPNMFSVSPERKALQESLYMDDVTWKFAHRWTNTVLEGKKAPTLEELLNDKDGELAYAMYLQAKPMLDQINSLLRSTKVDTVTASSIQDSIQTVKNLDNLSDFTGPLAAIISDTSVQGIYERINRRQVSLLREWFPVRAFDYSFLTENYVKYNNESMMYFSNAKRKSLFKKLSHHFVSYLYQNQNTTTFADLKEGKSKILFKSDIEFTGKIDVPVLWVEESNKILVNIDLLEQKFYDQKKKDYDSYERKNGVKFRYQGDFITHEIRKAVVKATTPSSTDDEIAHRVLLRSTSTDVLFNAASNYNIVSLFKSIKADANEIADSDLIQKIKPYSEGNAVGLRIAYSIADVSEYKEDIRKISQGTGATAIFFRYLSERIALQDNFEPYEGSLMPYVLDTDLARSVSDAMQSFTMMSESQRKMLALDFTNKFNKIRDTKSYLSIDRETPPGAMSKKTLAVTDGLVYSIRNVSVDENSNFTVDVLADPEQELVLKLTISKSGEIVGLDNSKTPKIHRNYGLELGSKTDLVVKEEPLETTTLTDEEVLEAMRKCNLA